MYHGRCHGYGDKLVRVGEHGAIMGRCHGYGDKLVRVGENGGMYHGAMSWLR